MKTFLILAVATTVAGALMAQAPPKTHLKVGDMAPDFKLQSTLGKPITLSEFRGKQMVVVAFFPAAFTGGWTKEAKGYQAGIKKFEDMGAQVVMISTDNAPTLAHWSKELEITYPMASDFMRKTAESYGVLIPERGIANRSTFVVDQEGKIQFIEEGNTAVDISGAAEACERVRKK